MKLRLRASCRPIAAGAVSLLFFSAVPAGAQSAEYDFFEREIRPVLIDHCYACHSAESPRLKAGLRLDTREGMLRGGESGIPAIVPGVADRSRLIEAIRYANPDLQMPPKGKLSDAQIEALVAWINQGAPDPRTETGPTSTDHVSPSEHWAFRPPQAVAVPEPTRADWAKTEIDRFILARLEAAGLAPSPPADRRTLIRRATYDLLGLPPTPDEVEAFASDEATDAFERVVDRLLASPHYGERWGRHWLDVARYADTKGYVYGDREEPRFVHSHVYRDWVIRALNEDMPYDRFLKLQLAADQMVSTEDPRDLAAMGFLTLGRRFLGVVHDIIDDRIDTVMRGTQGLTVSCARCHDHKFDPIPTEDYYSLYGIFAGSYEKTHCLETNPEGTEAYRAFQAEYEARVATLRDTFQRKCDELSNRLRGQVAEYLRALLEVDSLPNEDFYEIRQAGDLNPHIVRQWQAYLFKCGRNHPVFGIWQEMAPVAGENFGPKLDSLLPSEKKEENGSEQTSPYNKVLVAALRENRPANMRELAEHYGKLFAAVREEWRDYLDIAATSGIARPIGLPDADREELRQVLYGPDSPFNVPSAGAIVDLEWYFDEPTRVELAKLQSAIDKWIIESPGAPAHAVALEDRAAQRNPRVFKRGNPANKGPEVPRQFLSILTGPERKPFTQGSGRLELAQAIASRDNPLTARVMVNRVWQHHFGRGLVNTPSDFGTRCEPPSHPELLDWLAIWFMDHGWSLKKLHKLIMLSAVYQQSSEPVRVASRDAAMPTPHAVDPENRLLWRFNRTRLDFEGMRDTILFVTGELDTTLGGKPANLFSQPFSTRRSIYGLIDRQFLPGTFRVFDFPNPDMHSPQRYDTTVPQQALFFMNSPFIAERARNIELRPEIAEATDPAERVGRLYHFIFQREPSAREVERALAFVRSSEAPAAAEPRPRPEPAWQYGYGEYDAAAQRLKCFDPLPHFTGEAWQGGEKWPDATLGWLQLTAEGGHPGNDLQHAVVRRWVSPVDGFVSISGAIHHEAAAGDGIAARVVSSRSGQLGEWRLHNNSADLAIEKVEVRSGDTIDFIVDIAGNLNNDQYRWAPVVKRTQAPAAGDSNYLVEWNAKKDFAGPPGSEPEPLSPWAKYAQVLLLSNEFLFID